MKHHLFVSLFLIFVALPILILMVVAPMSTHNQFIYGITMVTTCFVAHFMSKKHFVSLGILLVAVISSTRYMFFRITQTLDFPSWIDMFFGYLLLFAEKQQVFL